MTNFEQVTHDIWVKMDRFREDASKYLLYGNQAASQRARKLSLELEKLMKQWRALSTGREQVTE